MEGLIATPKNSRPKANDVIEVNIAKPEAEEGVIWKVDRFATHDGPGIRTLLYLKGCPLRCKWCSNPEGQLSEPVLVFKKERCTDCGDCVEACPLQALEFQQTADVTKATLQINRSRCNVCGVCTSACPTNALEIWGKSYSVADVLEIIERDRPIYRRSGGGVTCTGGEPLQQGEFLRELLYACHRRGIHTAVETSAYADEGLFKTILEQVDWLFIDIKHTDPSAHRRFTGKSNEIILNNTRLASSVLLARNKALVVRMVVIPGINDGQHIHRLADFLCSLPFVTMVELLAYHDYGAHKYEFLGRSYSLANLKPPSAEEMQTCKKILEGRGLVVA